MEQPVGDADGPDSPAYFHGTKVDLKVGDLIAPGYASNYGSRKQASFVYLTATLEAAIWGAELAEDDPNLTNKRFPGNPTKSYRSRSPLRVASEIVDWTGHSPERQKEMHDHLQKLKQQGIEAIEE